MSATGSPASVRSLCQVMSAPISASVVNRPVLFGFMPIPVSVTSEFSEIAAATAAKAAELGSPGTITGRATSSGLSGQGDVGGIIRVMGNGDGGAKMGQHQFGMIAGRLRFNHGGVAGVFNPASRTADFTCAEATGNR